MILPLWRRFLGVFAGLRVFLNRASVAGRPPADLERAAAYHRAFGAGSADSLDDRTWTDLDLDEVFRAVDHTVSEPGRQYLYHLLRTPQHIREPLQHRERLVARLARDAALERQIRTALRPLERPRASELVDLMLPTFPARPRFWWLFPVLTASSVASLVVFLTVWPQAFTIWLGTCCLNLYVQMAYRPRVKRFVPALQELPAFLEAARVLGALDVPEAMDEVRCLEHGARKLWGLRRAASWLRFQPEEHELAGSLYEYANLFFLLDVNAFVFTVERLRAARSTMQEIFAALGYLDAMQSVNAWRRSLQCWSTPEFLPAGKVLRVKDVYHPLVLDPVPNSLDLDGTSLLISGSNMSGKTTFVRALGVNAVLAQALHTVCASEWSAPMLRVRTSIGRSDSITEGKSYYLAEVETIAALVGTKASGGQHLFLLDEIFRGTNTTERVAAGFAVLSYLNRGMDLVVVATHDIELIALLGHQFATRHFREEIANGAMTFDFRIREGPSSSRNAIRLLEVLMLPPDLVSDAMATLDWPTRSRQVVGPAPLR